MGINVADNSSGAPSAVSITLPVLGTCYVSGLYFYDDDEFVGITVESSLEPSTFSVTKVELYDSGDNLIAYSNPEVFSSFYEASGPEGWHYDRTFSSSTYISPIVVGTTYTARVYYEI